MFDKHLQKATGALGDDCHLGRFPFVGPKPGGQSRFCRLPDCLEPQIIPNSKAGINRALALNAWAFSPYSFDGLPYGLNCVFYGDFWVRFVGYEQALTSAWMFADDLNSKLTIAQALIEVVTETPSSFLLRIPTSMFGLKGGCPILPSIHMWLAQILTSTRSGWPFMEVDPDMSLYRHYGDGMLITNQNKMIGRFLYEHE